MPGRKAKPSAYSYTFDADDLTGDFVLEKSKNTEAQKREITRSQIALVYIVGFLLMILLALLIAFWKNFDINAMKDILVTLSGILSGPLGFIIGYYFKTAHENEKQ